MISLLGLTLQVAAEAPQVAIRYYADINCLKCDAFAALLPGYQEHYNADFGVVGVDIMNSENRRELEQRLRQYGQDYRTFPVVFVGNNAYQGISAIEQHFPRELEHVLETGTYRPQLAPEQTLASAPRPPQDQPPSAAYADGAGHTPMLQYFWMEGCPACARAAVFLDELEQRFPALEIDRLEVSQNRDNFARYRETARGRDIDAGAVPAFFLPGRHWIGFNQNIAVEIAEAVQTGLAGGWIDPHPAGSGFAQQQIELPLFGSISLANTPAFAVTAAIAAVDGFNPCSLWVLTFLIGLIIRTGSRRRTMAVGLAFLTVTATVYGLFILGLFTVFAAAGGLLSVRIIVAVLAVAMGLVNMKDYFAYKVGFSLTIPQRLQPAIARMGRGVFDRSGNPLAMLAMTMLFALGISVIELPCTAGFPIIWSQYVAASGISGGTFAALLALYLLVYLSIEIAVVVVSVVFMQRLAFGESHARVLKLSAGSIMVALGIAYLGIPQLTRTMSGVAWIFGSALVLSALIMITSHVIGRSSLASS
ncbi:MAG: thioredoxin [Spirochaetaceae bacterium]|nr:MAG: thioredoxin [Spirochaetaceae bacterium]